MKIKIKLNADETRELKEKGTTLTVDGEYLVYFDMEWEEYVVAKVVKEHWKVELDD